MSDRTHGLVWLVVRVVRSAANNGRAERRRVADPPVRTGIAPHGRVVVPNAGGEDAVMPMVLAFDVNETLLDLGALDPVFDHVLGDAALRPQWFATMLQLSFVGGLTRQYVDFTSAQQAALRMTAARAGRTVTDDDVNTVVDAMRQLPPHPEAAEALGRLRSAGLRLTALTNSVLEVAQAQLSHAGLAELFEGIFSADEVQALKPAAAPYRMVAQRCDIDIGELCLVAAHPWDVSGALAAGAQAAFVARAGIVPSPLGAQPHVVGADLTQVADALLAAHRPENTPAG